MASRRGRQVGLAACVAALLCVAPAWVAERARVQSPGNLAERAHATIANAIGDPRFVVGVYAGAGEATVLLADETGELRLEFDDPVTIATLLLRASGWSEYLVEASEDGLSWRTVWIVPSDERPGLRTRIERLATPFSARLVRLRCRDRGYGELPEVSQLRLYAGPPPEGAELGTPSPPAAYPWLSRSQVERAKVALGLLGAGLACAVFVAARRWPSSPAARRLRRLYVAVALLAGLGWWNFFQITRSDFEQTHEHLHDFYHYYLGSKYLPELSYTRLYLCQLAADVEDGLGRAHRTLRPNSRDLGTDRMRPTEELAGALDACRSRFTDERWQEYRADNRWLRARTPPGVYLWIATDRGYNGSPAFAALARPLAELLPLSEPAFRALASLDTLLLVAVWLAAWRGFGAVPASAALLLWSTNLVVDDREFFAGSFLRLSTFAFALLGVAALKVRRAGLAGVLLAGATLLRLFPVFLLVGPALRAAADLWSRRSLALPREARALALGAAATGGALLLLGGVAAGGPSSWLDFAGNTRKHVEAPTFQRVGLPALVWKYGTVDAHAPESAVRDRREAAAASPLRRTLRFGLPLLVLVPLALLIRREEQWVAAILGVAWLPFVIDLSNYDWNIVALFGLLTARLPSLLPSVAALNVALVMIGALLTRDGLERYLCGSAALLLFSAVALGTLARERMRRDAGGSG